MPHVGNKRSAAAGLVLAASPRRRSWLPTNDAGECFAVGWGARGTRGPARRVTGSPFHVGHFTAHFPIPQSAPSRSTMAGLASQHTRQLVLCFRRMRQRSGSPQGEGCAGVARACSARDGMPFSSNRRVPGRALWRWASGGGRMNNRETFLRLSSLGGASADRPRVQPVISACGVLLPRGGGRTLPRRAPPLAVRRDASPCRTRSSEHQGGTRTRSILGNSDSRSPLDSLSADGARVRREPWRRGGTRSWGVGEPTSPLEYLPLPLQNSGESRMSAQAGGGARGKGWTSTRCSSAGCQGCAPELACTARRYMRWVL